VPVVQDESLIDEMRSVLQGDRDRAESRRLASSSPRAQASPQAERRPDEHARERFGLLARLRRRS
jgi:hypothetical protein